MPHKVISSIIALVFLVLIQTTSKVFRFLLPVMLLYFIVVMAYNYWYLKKHNFYVFWSWLRMLFFLASIVSIYFVIPSGFIKGIFLIFASAFVYFLELRLLIASEQVLFFETLLSYFGLALGIFGNNYYLLPKNFITLILLGLATYLIARASFDYAPQSRQQKNFFAWFIAFCVLEVSWALIFLPFHFTVLAVILFNIFYVLWIITYYHLFHNLSMKKVSFHMIFSTILILLTLLSTPWKI
ncbi:MAG: hypothetical protein JWO40_495 [Candidatus Doudnabacteria bacterium]|nr:hypothetical protein [Candidatus Doudnabacteria bacterium]